MHSSLIKAKYKNFLDSNFFFTSDQNQASNILSKVKNNDIDLIIEKSKNILSDVSSSSNKIKILEIFANSDSDKIHALSACAPIINDMSWDSDKMSLINKLDKIDGAKIYAVSLAKDLIKDLTWKSEKNDLLNSIISAKTTEEAYNLVGFNDNTSNLPFLPVQNNSFYYPEPQLNLINSYPPYPINNKGYLPKIGFDNLQNENQNFPSYYPQPQPNIVSPYPHYQTNKNEPIVHNHYYVNESNNNENLNDNNKHSTEKESADEEIGTLEWLGALAVMAFGIFGTFSSLNSDEKKSSIISHEDSYHQNNYSENKFFDEKPSAPYYDKLYPDISFYDKDDLPSYNDLPPSYESLFGSK